MDEAAWRITVAMPDGHAKALREQLEHSPELDLGSNDDNVYVYAPTREEIERYVPTIRSALNALAIEPTSVEIDQWLADQTRWSSEDSDDSEGDDRGWVESILDGLTRNSPI